MFPDALCQVSQPRLPHLTRNVYHRPKHMKRKNGIALSLPAPSAKSRVFRGSLASCAGLGCSKLQGDTCHNEARRIQRSTLDAVPANQAQHTAWSR